MVRLLITGSNGLLGQKLAELFLRSTHYSVVLTSSQPESVLQNERIDYRQVDISQKADVRRIVEETEPEVIINAAAMTDVDRCETDRERAWRTNVVGVENLAYSAKLVGARIIQISTDYVFDGKSGPYDELNRPNPISYYGRTKLAAENVLRTTGIPHCIIRTMVLYGMGFQVKLNFALWALKSLSDGTSIRAVDDQFGNPTLVDDLAFAILPVVEGGRTGIYHIAGAELTSRYEFARQIASTFGFDLKMVTPIKSATLKQAAARPLKSGFVTLKAETELGIRMSGVKQGLSVLKNQMAVSMKEHSTH
jgi:dTDP-4-dehydrorhamnose reductase